MRNLSTALKISYAPYLPIQVRGDLCGSRIRIQLRQELYAETGYAKISDRSCMRTELYAYLLSTYALMSFSPWVIQYINLAKLSSGLQNC